MKNSVEQTEQTVNLLKNVIGHDLLGIYLYGSAVVGGLKKYSDIDLFVIINHSLGLDEKKALVLGLLDISGIYMKSADRPIELTIVTQSSIIPWQYPPECEFQYGEWLREAYESGNMDPLPSKSMPDLAMLITQVALSGQVLLGIAPDQILPEIPYEDILNTMEAELSELMSYLESDTRNVLLTLARIWFTLESDKIPSKKESADWVIAHLPDEYQVVLERAQAIYLGEEKESWEDLDALIKPCASFMLNKNKEIIQHRRSTDDMHRLIKMNTLN